MSVNMSYIFTSIPPFYNIFLLSPKPSQHGPPWIVWIHKTDRVYCVVGIVCWSTIISTKCSMLIYSFEQSDVIVVHCVIFSQWKALKFPYIFTPIPKHTVNISLLPRSTSPTTQWSLFLSPLHRVYLTKLVVWALSVSTILLNHKFFYILENIFKYLFVTSESNR